MPCPKTAHLLTEYFDEGLGKTAHREIERHIQNCPCCAAELEELLAAQSLLGQWREQRVPHWDRGTASFRAEHRADAFGKSRAWLQWFPAAASLAMLVVMVLNVSVVGNETGFSLTFGLPASSTGNSQFTERLTDFAAQQRREQEAALQQLSAQVNQQLASNNQRVTSTLMELTRELNADNFERVLAYFEQQRELDMESMRVSYQQLLDSDFETLRTMEQLAGYIQTQSQFQ